MLSRILCELPYPIGVGIDLDLHIDHLVAHEVSLLHHPGTSPALNRVSELPLVPSHEPNLARRKFRCVDQAESDACSAVT